MRPHPALVSVLVLLAGCGERGASADSTRAAQPIAAAAVDVQPRRVGAGEAAWQAALEEARAAGAAGDQARALAALRTAVQRSAAFADARHALSLAALAEALAGSGDSAEAERCWRQALDLHAAPGGDALAAAHCRDALAALCAGAGRLPEAERLLRDALDARRERLPADHDDLAAANARLADVLRAQGAAAAAEPLYRSALAVWERPGAGAAPRANAAAARHGLGLALAAAGDQAAGIAQIAAGLAALEALHGADDPALVPPLMDLSGLRSAAGQHDAAIAAAARALALAERRFGGEHAALAPLLGQQALMLAAAGRWTPAAAAAERAVGLHARSGSDTPEHVRALSECSALHARAGDLSRALTHGRAALAIVERVLPAEHPDLAVARANCAELERLASARSDGTPAR